MLVSTKNKFDRSAVSLQLQQNVQAGFGLRNRNSFQLVAKKRALQNIQARFGLDNWNSAQLVGTDFLFHQRRKPDSKVGIELLDRAFFEG